jgi:hypothetical protein
MILVCWIADRSADISTDNYFLIAFRSDTKHSRFSSISESNYVRERENDEELIS